MGASGPHDPKEVVRDFAARLNRGGAPFAVLAESVVVTLNGTTPLSGRYPGIELVRGVLVDSARLVIAAMTVEVRELIGTGKRVAALLAISGRTVTGATFNDDGRPCGGVFEVEQGKITEIILFPDTSLIELALYRRRYVPDP